MSEHDDIQAALERIFSADSSIYQQRGFQRRVGFGEHPALIHIDLAYAWTRPGNAFSCEDDVSCRESNPRDEDVDRKRVFFRSIPSCQLHARNCELSPA